MFEKCTGTVTDTRRRRRRKKKRTLLLPTID